MQRSKWEDMIGSSSEGMIVEILMKNELPGGAAGATVVLTRWDGSRTSANVVAVSAEKAANSFQ